MNRSELFRLLCAVAGFLIFLIYLEGWSGIGGSGGIGSALQQEGITSLFGILILLPVGLVLPAVANRYVALVAGVYDLFFIQFLFFGLGLYAVVFSFPGLLVLSLTSTVLYFIAFAVATGKRREAGVHA